MGYKHTKSKNNQELANELYQVIYNDPYARRKLASRDLYFFINWYLRHRLTNPATKQYVHPALPHIRTCQVLSQHQTYKRVMAMFSRTLGKSSLKWMHWAWKIATDPDQKGGRQILDFTSPQMVTKGIRNLATELLHNKLIREDFGVLLDSKCKLSIEKSPEIITKNNWHIFARSIESGIRGEHPAELDIDDVLDRELIKNPHQRDKLEEIYAYDVQGMMFPGFRERFWGTPMHPQDLIMRLFNEGKWDMRLKYPIEFVKNGERQSMWPDMYSLKDIDAIRERVEKISPGAFRQEYLLEPFLAENLLFTEDMLQFYNKKPLNTTDMIVYTGVDLAIGVREENCQTAISSWGGLTHNTDLAEQGTVFELRTDCNWYSTEESAHIFLQHCKQFNFKNICKLEDAAGAEKWWELVRLIAEREGYKTLPNVDFVKVHRGLDKHTRATHVRPLFSDHLVWQDKESPVAQQMTVFTGRPGERNDAVDAAVHALTDFVGYQWYSFGYNSSDSFSNEVMVRPNIYMR